jgi:hypothetical protein
MKEGASMKVIRFYAVVLVFFSIYFAGCKADIDIKTPNVPQVQQVITTDSEIIAGVDVNKRSYFYCTLTTVLIVKGFLGEDFSRVEDLKRMDKNLLAAAYRPENEPVMERYRIDVTGNMGTSFDKEYGFQVNWWDWVEGETCSDEGCQTAREQALAANMAMFKRMYALELETAYTLEVINSENSQMAELIWNAFKNHQGTPDFVFPVIIRSGESSLHNVVVVGIYQKDKTQPKEETGYFYVNDPMEKAGYKKIIYAEFAWMLGLNNDSASYQWLAEAMKEFENPGIGFMISK